MKTIKFLVQTLLIAVPLAFASCSSDNDDFYVPTPENSDILLSEYKIASDASGDYSGVSFTYNSNNELSEAISYDYDASTNTKKYTYKYVFGAKTNNKKEVEVYINHSTSLDNWNTYLSSNLNYNTTGKIVKIEDYWGLTDVNITWDGDRAIKMMPETMPSMADSAQYYKGNYMDYPALEIEDARWDNYSKSTTTFTTYANYWQMIPVEFYFTDLARTIHIGAYFSDNAVAKTIFTNEQNHYTDETKTQLSSSFENTSTTDYALTFGSISKRVPEKVKITTSGVNKRTDYIDPSNSYDYPSTLEQTYTFTYVKK